VSASRSKYLEAITEQHETVAAAARSLAFEQILDRTLYNTRCAECAVQPAAQSVQRLCEILSAIDKQTSSLVSIGNRHSSFSTDDTALYLWLLLAGLKFLGVPGKNVSR